MKKEINNLIKQQGTLRLNEFTKLRKWNRDALGSNVDMLTVDFDITGYI